MWPSVARPSWDGVQWSMPSSYPTCLPTMSHCCRAESHGAHPSLLRLLEAAIGLETQEILVGKETIAWLTFCDVIHVLGSASVYLSIYVIHMPPFRSCFIHILESLIFLLPWQKSNGSHGPPLKPNTIRSAQRHFSKKHSGVQIMQYVGCGN